MHKVQGPVRHSRILEKQVRRQSKFGGKLKLKSLVQLPQFYLILSAQSITTGL